MVCAYLLSSTLYSRSAPDSHVFFPTEPELTFLFTPHGEKTLSSPKLFEATDPLALTIQNA